MRHSTQHTTHNTQQTRPNHLDHAALNTQHLDFLKSCEGGRTQTAHSTKHTEALEIMDHAP